MGVSLKNHLFKKFSSESQANPQTAIPTPRQTQLILILGHTSCAAIRGATRSFLNSSQNKAAHRDAINT